MTAEQHPLFLDPQWTERWSIGVRVRSAFTGNTGEVVGVVPGRHLLVRWERTPRWAPYVVRHGSELGLIREVAVRCRTCDGAQPLHEVNPGHADGARSTWVGACVRCGRHWAVIASVAQVPSRGRPS